MKAKIIVSTVLFAFVAASIAFFIVKERERAVRNAQASKEAGGAAGETEDDRLGAPPEETGALTAGRAADGSQEDAVVVYYFHGTRRCPTCRKIEEYTNDAVAEGFTEELQSGAIIWRVVNVEEPGNEHFIDDYRLSTKSVVLVRLAGGREADWKNLSRIWDLVGERAAFMAYIQDEVKRFERGPS